VLRANLKWDLVSRSMGLYLALLIVTTGIVGCQQTPTAPDNSLATSSSNSALTNTDGPLSEVNTPVSISKLAPSLAKFQPQVQILSPKLDQILSDDRVTVKLQVDDLPLFKQLDLGLGNHLQVILDKQTYQDVYDLTQPLVFKNLAAGTHTLRVFASRPWYESFKNEGAFDLVTFHVLTKTAENNPDPQQPLLTYSRATSTYGTEPILLDYYLTNAPTYLVADSSQDPVPGWRIRVTLNEQRFILDRWAPVYLQGFKQGKNWVRLELIDDRGNPIPNVYNDTVAIITYDPQTKDPLSRLIDGEIESNLARTIVEPNYIASNPAPAPVISVPIPVQIAPSPVLTPPIIKPSPKPAILTPPIVILPPSGVQAIPSPILPKIAPSLSPTIVQPETSPSPTSAPVVIKLPNVKIELPIPATQLNPVQPPTPESAKNSLSPSPKPSEIVTPVLIPQPSPSSVPSAANGASEIVIMPPQIKVQNNSAKLPLIVDGADRVESTPQDRHTLPVETPSTSIPQLEGNDRPSWLTRSIELFDIVRAKIRAFTNTIPAKAQRFGHGAGIWIESARSYTKAQIQQWRNQLGVDS